MSNKKKSSFFILIIVLIIYSALITTTHHYERLTADSTIYLDLAEKYLRGEFTDAVNGYWGPLLTWLFIPFLYFGVSPVIVINTLNLIIGIFTALGVWRLSYRFEVTEKIRGAILIALLPVMLLFSMVEIFDFLLVCFIVCYLSVIFNNDYHNKISRGMFCGFFGAFAYFSKSYAFPFFIVHFFIMNILHFIRCSSKAEKQNVLRNAAAGFIIFAIIIAPWIAAISVKYEGFTFSNTGKGNFASIGPEDPETGLERGVIIFHDGLFPPTNETATSVWEDPSYIWKDVVSWTPLDSPLHFKHFIKNIAKNVIETINIYESFSKLAVAIMVVYLLLLAAGPFDKQLLRGDRLYSFLTVIIYSGGYLPFHVEHRYLWTINILLLLMGGYVLNELYKNNFFRKTSLTNILLVIFVLSFMITPLKSFAGAGKHNINKDMYFFSEILKDKYNIKGNIASNREWQHVPIHDSWHKTFRLSYWLDSKYFGQTQAVISDEDLKGDLIKHNIDYYLIWGESPHIPDVLSNYKELTNGEYPDLKVYSLKEEIK
jgi:hypothetical protein